MNQLNNNGGLTFRDCILLGSLFEEHAGMLFPFPAAVRLYAAYRNETRPEPGHWPSPLVRYLQSAGTPEDAELVGYHDGAVYCPLNLADDGTAFLVFSGLDTALLKKFSRDWFLSFQAQVHQCLTEIRLGYVDPETGLYNRRALICGLKEKCPDNREMSSTALYFIHLSFVRRSISGAMRRVRYFADLFATVDNQGLFFLGQDVYALVLKASGQEEQRMLARGLQKFLRREKLQRVHIAFGDCVSLIGLARQEDETGADPFARIVEALDLARQRGPFGICDAKVLDGQARHPFVMPPRSIIRKLQRRWRNMDRFCLALFSQKESSGGDTSLAPAIAGLIFDEQEKFHLVPVSTGQVFVLFSFADRSDPERYIKKMHHDLQQFQKSPVSVGYCTYPDGNGSRTESIRRCYKALMHGDFYGEGSVVHFDHLSLNVSGDWYFEQGDFRQAVREYSQGLKRVPGEKNLLNSLGVALIEMKRISQAITAFHDVLEQDPDNYMALVNLGSAFLQKGQREKALCFFEKAYAVQYHAGLEGVDVLRQLSRLYIFLGRFQDALVALRRWQEAGDTEQDYLFHQLLGRALFETGSAAPAMKALQKALRLHPKDAESMSLLGLLYISENEGEEAGRILLEKALSLDGSRAVYWYRYGAALLHLARYDQAIAAVRKSLRLKKTDIDAGLLLVEILLRQQKMKLARRHLDRLQARNGMSAGQKQRAAKLFSEFFDKSKKET